MTFQIGSRTFTVSKNGWFIFLLFWWQKAEKRPASFGLLGLFLAAVMSAIAFVFLPVWVVLNLAAGVALLVMIAFMTIRDFWNEHCAEIFTQIFAYTMLAVTLSFVYGFIGFGFVVGPATLWWSGQHTFVESFGLDIMLGGIAGFLYTTILAVNYIPKLWRAAQQKDYFVLIKTA